MVLSDEEADRLEAFLKKSKEAKHHCESCGRPLEEHEVRGIKGLAPPFSQPILCKKCYGEKGPLLRTVKSPEEET